MNNKSLSKIYNVKYMDYPDFLIHIFKVLSSIFIELMHLMDGYFLYVMVHSILYFYVISYIISISFIELYSNIHIQTKFQEGS